MVKLSLFLLLTTALVLCADVSAMDHAGREQVTQKPCTHRRNRNVLREEFYRERELVVHNEQRRQEEQQQQYEKRMTYLFSQSETVMPVYPL